MQRGQLIQFFSLGLLSLHGLADAVSNAGLVESLIRQDCHLYLVAHPYQQEAALGTINRSLANEFVEGLGVEVFSDGADAGLAGLALLQALVEFLLEGADVEPGRWNGRDVLEPELAILFVFVGGQYRVEVVFGLGLLCGGEAAGAGFGAAVGLGADLA